MAAVELRDIVTDADRAAAIAVQAGPGQDRFVASVEQSLKDALAYAHAKPPYWTVNDEDEVVLRFDLAAIPESAGTLAT